MTGIEAGSIYRLRTPRVHLDPNDLAPGESRYHIALFDDADAEVFPGEVVIVVQKSDDDEPNLIGIARIARVNKAREVIYLEVQRGSFRPEMPQIAPALAPVSASSMSQWVPTATAPNSNELREVALVTAFA